MSYKNNVSVRICGKTMVLSGNESVEYITKVANYIEQKADALRQSDNSKSLNANLVSVLTSINIADDFFKETAKNKELVKEIEDLKSNTLNSEGLYGDKKQIHELEIDQLSVELEIVKEERDNLLNEIEALKEKNINLDNELKKQISKVNHIKSDEYRKKMQMSMQKSKNDISSNEIEPEIQEAIMTDIHKGVSPIKNYYKNT